MVTLIVDVVVLGLIYWLVSLIPLPEPFPIVVKIIFIVLLVLLVLRAFGVATGVAI